MTGVQACSLPILTCNECGGRGTTMGKKCTHCHGNKVMDHTQHYTLEVPKGVPEGHEVVFEGEADESPDWEPGDVVIRIRSKKERGGWRRKESGLYWRETLSVEEVRRDRFVGELVLSSHGFGIGASRL